MNKKLLQERKERYIRNLIKEAIINVLAEQEELSAVPPATTPPAPQTNMPDMPPPSTPDQPAPDPSAQKEFTVDTMVEQLNILRGGKSLKDPEVYGKLTTFFNNLTEEQVTSLKWVLEELIKIVTNVNELNPSQSLEQPAAPPASPPPAPPAAPAPSVAPATPAPITPSV